MNRDNLVVILAVPLMVVAVIAVGVVNVALANHDRSLFEQKFGIKYPESEGERQVARLKVVEKLSSLYGEVATLQQERTVLVLRKKEGETDSVAVAKKEEELQLSWESYRSHLYSAWNVGFRKEALSMPENGIS